MIVCTISLGYSAFCNEMSISNIVADIRIVKDVRITSFVYNSATNDAIPSYENYDVDSILSNVSLPNQNSTITFKVGVTNFGNIDMGIYSINGLPSNLTYELSDYALYDKLCSDAGSCTLGVTGNFYLTI